MVVTLVASQREVLHLSELEIRLSEVKRLLIYWLGSRRRPTYPNKRYISSRKRRQSNQDQVHLPLLLVKDLKRQRRKLLVK